MKEGKGRAMMENRDFLIPGRNLTEEGEKNENGTESGGWVELDCVGCTATTPNGGGGKNTTKLPRLGHQPVGSFFFYFFSIL